MALTSESMSVSNPEWGSIHVHNVRPAGQNAFEPDRIVVLQHGATYGSVGFEMQFGGLSWMDYLAQRGFDTYCLELPGYGRSERPPQMSAPADENPPFMRTSDAAGCLGSVIDFVRERRGVERLCLIGWSWGTAITSYYAAEHPRVVERLALYAPAWHRNDDTPSPIQVEGKLGAYRTVDRAATLARRQAALDPATAAEVMPPAWFDAWWEASVANDPDGGGESIRAPNGVVQDSEAYWGVGRSLYDPAAITAPVLLVVGEWDRDTPPYMAQTLFPEFTNAPWKRLSVLSGGTHSMLMESNRMLLFRTVSQFLEELPPGVDALA